MLTPTGAPGLWLALLLAAGGIAAGLYMRQAASGRYLAIPWMAALVVGVGGAVWSFIAPVFPHGLATAAGAVFLGGLGFLAGCWEPQGLREPKHRRGARVEHAAAEAHAAGEPAPSRPGHPDAPIKPYWVTRFDPAAHAAGGPDDSRVTLAGRRVPALDETKHFKLLGTTGTGKSTAIRELLGGALARGDRAVIADPDGGYLTRFYEPHRGDVILNPFDARSGKWDLFGEIRNPYDFDQLARSLIPDGAGESHAWKQYAQTLLSAVMRRAHTAGIRDTGELYRLLVAAPADELRLLLEGTAAQAFLAAGNERMWGSIRSVATAAVTALDFINAQHGARFSIRDWIKNGRGVLFLPYNADQIAALRAVISTWMRLAIFETMTLPEGDARLWFVVDELDALGQIDGLKDALARLRKFGGRCVLGFQSIAQVSGTYGRSEAETIVENCGNTLILRCSASEHGGTAQFASDLIGEREVFRRHVSRTRRPTDLFATRTVSEQPAMETAVLASEIEQLPDLTGYLKFASMPLWLRVELSAAPSAARQRDAGRNAAGQNV